MPDDLKCLHCGKEVGKRLSQEGLCSECAQLLSTAATPLTGEDAPEST